ncbi:hypothetical protein MTR67_039202 [Solanum verrucosum]|uniref:Uncharacterized protein n=1 Tax=Solanum verrucosum TaxID=315347 RepID=A0AAF0UGS7_SOLVR|nr:hypothetical protein MTR67_039202 [Solanum verrucosum]
MPQAMKAKYQGNDIMRQKGAKNAENLKKSKAGTRQGHLETHRVDLQLAQSSRVPALGQDQLEMNINGSNAIQLGNNDDIRNLHDVNEDRMESAGVAPKAVNAVGVNGVNPDEAHIETMNNEKVHFLANQKGGFPPNYPRSGGNEGLNRDPDDGWRDQDRELREHGTNWREPDGHKERYVLPYKRQNPREPRANP